MTTCDVSLEVLMQKCFGERVSPATCRGSPHREESGPGCAASHLSFAPQSLHLILCVSQRGDNFSFECVEAKKRKDKSQGIITPLPLAGTRHLHFTQEWRGAQLRT